MVAQTEVTDNAILNANRTSDDWAQARMQADLEILCVEDLEESCARARAVSEKNMQAQEVEEVKLQMILGRFEEARAAAEAAAVEEEAAFKARNVKQAEFDFQSAKQAKSIVKKQEMDGEVKAGLRQTVLLQEELRGLMRVYKFDEDQNIRLEAVARCRIQQSQVPIILPAS